MPRNVVSSRVASANRAAVSTGRSIPFDFANSLTFSASGNSYGSAVAPADIKVNARSIEWWTLFDIVPTGTSPIFSLGVAHYYMGFNLNSLMHSYRDAAEVQRTVFSNTTIFRPSVWEHFAITLETTGMDVVMTFYRNGTQIGTTTRTDGHSAAYGANLYLATFAPASLNLNGKLANFGFYNRALTAAEVLDRSRRMPVTSGNLHRWLATEGSGASLGDSIGSTTFTLTNSPTWSSVNVPSKARVAVS